MTRITCAEGVDQLMDYLEGMVPPDLRAALELHVTGCPRCAAFITSYRETSRIVRDATAASLPADYRRTLREFLGSL
jgi:anti-sigma factor RsiW